jgi:hypothetical protein
MPADPNAGEQVEHTLKFAETLQSNIHKAGPVKPDITSAGTDSVALRAVTEKGAAMILTRKPIIKDMFALSTFTPAAPTDHQDVGCSRSARRCMQYDDTTTVVRRLRAARWRLVNQLVHREPTIIAPRMVGIVE